MRVHNGATAAPRAARHAVAGLRAISQEHAANVDVLLTELVANSVLHAGLRADQPIVVVVRRSPGVLRVEVADEGPGFEYSPASADPLAPGGRGLMLVECLSDRWGRLARAWNMRLVRAGRQPGGFGGDAPNNGSHLARAGAPSAVLTATIIVITRGNRTRRQETRT